jgi:phosphoglycerate dehydrogenase-like enzyme
MKTLIYTITDPAPVAAALEATGRLQVHVAESDADFAREVGTAEAVVLGSSRYGRVASSITGGAPLLRWIQFSSSGYDTLKREALRPDIAITRAVGVWTPMVAEHAMALSLALIRRLPELDIHRRERHWADRTAIGPMGSLSGMNVLIVGYGDVGKRFAALARPFGAVITAVAQTARTEEGVDIHAVSELPALLPQADLVALTLPGSSDGRPLMDATNLRLMKPSACLVNVGRGSLIDETALIQRLTDGQLAGAGLDVASKEPLPASAPLWTASNLILTPHLAGNGDPTALGRLAALCTTNALNLLEGRPLVGAI